MDGNLTRRNFLEGSAIAGGVALGIGKAFSSTPRQTDGNKRPNILFIINDQHNPRHMGWAGETKVKTPFIDKLADESVCFTNGYCNNPVCGPSRHCLYTGRYASEHHVMTNDTEMNGNCKTLMAHLNEVGYTTANIGKMHNTPYNHCRDFQYVLNHEFYDSDAGISHYAPYLKQQLEKHAYTPPTQPWHQSETKGNWLEDSRCVGFENNWLPEKLTAEQWIADQSLAFLKDQKERRPDQPFFLHASFFPPHHPYGPVTKYADMYRAEDMELPPNFDLRALEEWSRGRGAPKNLDVEELKRLKALYFGFITQFDAAMGHLLQGVEELGYKENTIVVFTSDHGDMMGEHGRLYKDVMYEASVRVPMMVRWPGITSPREESRLVSMIDFMPTFLAAAGIEPDKALPGKDIKPIVQGEQTDWQNRAVFSEYNSEFPYLFHMWRKGDFKLIVTNRNGNVAYEFFNVTYDPYELTDLIGDSGHQALVAEFKNELYAHWEDLAKKLPPAKPISPKRLEYNCTWPTDPWKPVEPVSV